MCTLHIQDNNVILLIEPQPSLIRRLNKCYMFCFIMNSQLHVKVNIEFILLFIEHYGVSTNTVVAQNTVFPNLWDGLPQT